MRTRFKPNKIRFSLLWLVSALLLGVFTLLTNSSYSQFVHAESIPQIEDSTTLLNGYLYSNRVTRGNSFNIVKVINGREVKFFLTSLVKTSDILDKMEIITDQDDIVVPNLSENIDSNNTIKVVFVEEKYTEELEGIPYTSVTKEDPDLTVKQRIIAQEGKDGVKKIIYLSRFENGEETSRDYYSAQTVTPAIEEIIKVAPPRNVLSQRNCPMWNSVIDELTSDERTRTILKGIIVCESHCNQTSDNGYYFGLMQFNKATFKTYGGTNIWDGRDQLETALRIYQKGGEPNMAWHWPVCYKHAVGIN